VNIADELGRVLRWEGPAFVHREVSCEAALRFRGTRTRQQRANQGTVSVLI